MGRSCLTYEKKDDERSGLNGTSMENVYTRKPKQIWRNLMRQNLQIMKVRNTKVKYKITKVQR